MVAARRTAKSPPSQAADERLLVAAAQGDPSKFAALYELHFERVYFFIVGRVRDRGTAEDLTSEVFHKALANLSSYEWRGTSFSAWLFRMASNAIIDQFKRSSRERTSGDDPAAPKAALSPSLQEVRAINYRIQLFQLVEKLPAAQRRVIYERFVVQRNIREIASLLKKSEGAIKQLQFRALQTLRAQMEGRHA